MKVALIHDYLIEYGGAERVLEALHQIFPEAPIYTAFLDLSSLGPHAERIKKWIIKTSWLQNFPFARKLISPLRIAAPAIFESFNLSEYDLVISSCNIYFAKAVITKPEALHLSYIHTPPRYLYGYTTSFNYKKHWWSAFLGELANHFLRIWDFELSQRPDILIANSKNVAERIKKFYRRDSVLIYPPVGMSDTQSQISKGKRDFFLSVARLVRGKGVEVVVAAATKLGLPLKVVGSGPEMDELKKIVSRQSKIINQVEFLGEVNDQELAKLYAGAKALVVASEDEDFGITAVEAQALGTPVIAPRSGGFLETVIEGKTGILYGEPRVVSVDSLIEALKKFDSKDFKEEDLRKQAAKFSYEKFKSQISELVGKNLKKG